jgi:hypothetical protein
MIPINGARREKKSTETEENIIVAAKSSAARVAIAPICLALCIYDSSPQYAVAATGLRVAIG